MGRQTTIFYPQSLRDRWPEPLAREWLASYPDIFDQDDLRLTSKQRKHHFFEWLAAIHVFQRDGAISLIEKYGYRKNPRQVRRLDELLPVSDAQFLREFRSTQGVQPPDLLVYMPDKSKYWFAEVKGPRDQLSTQQRASHARIAHTLNAEVEVISVKPVRYPSDG